MKGSGVGDLDFPVAGEEIKDVGRGCAAIHPRPSSCLRDRTAGVEVISRDDSLAGARRCVARVTGGEGEVTLVGMDVPQTRPPRQIVEHWPRSTSSDPRFAWTVAAKATRLPCMIRSLMEGSLSMELDGPGRPW